MQIVPDKDGIQCSSSSKVAKLKPKRRSRNGCLNCKRLKIKCDEIHPSCEHCLQTNKKCVYWNQSMNSLDNSSIIQTLNSMQSQMKINRLELRLLKFYIGFGGEFFSFSRTGKLTNLWAVEIPKLWNDSELIRNALFAISSIKLWTKYNLSDIKNVKFIEDYSENNDKNIDLTNNISILFDRTNFYFQKTLKLLSDVKYSQPTEFESTVQSLIAHIIVFSFVSISPVSPISLVSSNKADDNGFSKHEIDLFHIAQSLMFCVTKAFKFLKNTKYEPLAVSPDEDSTSDIDTNPKPSLPFIDHLKRYTMTNNDDGVEFLTCINAINILEHSCYESLKSGYPWPIYRTILSLSGDPQFVKLLRENNHITTKIMYHYCCLCSIFNFKLFKEQSIWDQFIDQFLSQHKVDEAGKIIFGDRVDENMYTVTKFCKSKYLNLDLLSSRIKIMDLMISLGTENIVLENLKGKIKGFSTDDIKRNELDQIFTLNKFALE
ncbi:hypothetical protein WICMUC_002506 [Wickerhamomyces mucosus]|uniref:Zn(2)-C6 fungal-type domain-containing protein n=1 Tax=Wickerhamomyces mucosus TaxID=1378264 RepID=A0A9P8PQK0_9ASCO|nr:hypothetical protein WICMUC_002506 [Wickerhamomyces mucosus]